MTPDEPRVISQSYKFHDATLVAPDGREYPIKTIVVETLVREYRANNGEVCRMETIAEKVFAHGKD